MPATTGIGNLSNGWNHKDKTCFSSAIFPEPEPDRAPVEVHAQKGYQYLLLPNQGKVQAGHLAILRKYRPV